MKAKRICQKKGWFLVSQLGKSTVSKCSLLKSRGRRDPQNFNPEEFRNNLKKWVLRLIFALKLSMPTKHTVSLPGGVGWG